MNTFRINVQRIIMGLALFFMPHASALEVGDIAGTYDVVNDGKKHLSPAHGCMWYEAGVIKNMVLFGDQNDAPIALAKALFHYHPVDRVLRPTASQANTAYYLTPSLIAAIIEELEKDMNPSDLGDRIQKILKNSLDGKKKQWENDLAQLPSQEKLEKSKTKIELEISKLRYRIEKGNQNTQEQNQKLLESEIKKWQAVQMELAEITPEQKNEIKKVNERLNYLRTATKGIAPFSALIADSCATKSEWYIPCTTQRLLLSLLWAKAETRQHILDYFDAFQSPIVVIDNRQAWLSACYTKEQYDQALFKFIDQPEELLKERERALFVSCAHKCGSYSVNVGYEPIDYGSVSFIDKEKEEYTFSDCGETSLRNFINLMLYDAKTNTVDWSRLAKNKLFMPAPLLIEFYEKLEKSAQDPQDKRSNQQKIKAVYDDWAQVVSGLPGVAYARGGVCELPGGLAPVLDVLNHLLFGNDSEFSKKTNTEKLNLILKSFLGEKSAIEWQEENNKNIDEKTINICIQFSVKKCSYNWKFKRGHYYLEKVKDHQVIHSSKKIVDSLSEHKKDDGFALYIRNYWMNPNLESMNKLAECKNKANNYLFFCMQDFSQGQYKEDFLKAVVEGNFDLPEIVIQNLIRSEEGDEGMYVQLIEQLVGSHSSSIHQEFLKQAIMKIFEESVLVRGIVQKIVNLKLKEYYPLLTFDIMLQARVCLHTMLQEKLIDQIDKDKVDKLDIMSKGYFTKQVVGPKLKEYYPLLTVEMLVYGEIPVSVMLQENLIKAIDQETFEHLSINAKTCLSFTIVKNKEEKLYPIIQQVLMLTEGTNDPRINLLRSKIKKNNIELKQ